MLVRGLPGSGKSTYARYLVAIGVCDSHYETDRYFYQEGQYVYDPAKLGRYHRQCFQDTKNALERGETVVVANTFTRRWEMEPYLELGCLYIIVEMMEPFGNIHNVPEATIAKMKERWESV